MSRFYNPGTALEERLQYTNPAKDAKDTNTTSYHLLRAEEKAFFEVPDVISLDTLDGEIQVPVSFAKIVKRQHSRRGVVLVDPRAKKAADDDNIAPTDDAATKKGDAMWKDYLKQTCQEWYTIVSEIKQQGGVPRAAQGLFKYALKALHMEDPADTVDTITRAKEGQQTNASTVAQMQEMRDMIMKLQGQLAAKA